MKSRNKTHLCYFCRYKNTCKLDHLIRVIQQDEVCYLYAVTTPSQTHQNPNLQNPQPIPLTLENTHVEFDAPRLTKGIGITDKGG